LRDLNMLAGVLVAIATYNRRCVANVTAVPEGKAQERAALKGSAVRSMLT